MGDITMCTSVCLGRGGGGAGGGAVAAIIKLLGGNDFIFCLSIAQAPGTGAQHISSNQSGMNQ